MMTRVRSLTMAELGVSCGLWLLVAGLLSMKGTVVSAQETTAGRKYAVLVGVREYDRNQLRNLTYPENDVQELAGVLKEVGFRRVVLLTQTEGAKTQRSLPLAKNIRTELAGILEDRTPDDLVLVAFAGHGVQYAGEQASFFCPMDAVLTDRSTLVSVAEVYKQLEQSRAGTKLLLVDACRNDPQSVNSRALAEVKLESVTRPQQIAPPGGVAALFSCSAGQKAFEDESLKHGIFFHHVILGLKGEARLAKRDEVTWDSLVAYVKAEVPDTVKDKIGSTSRQIPEQRGELRGGVTLVSLSRGKPSETSPPATIPPKEIKSKSTGMKLTLIPAGTFTMGSPASESEQFDNKGPPSFDAEGPQHTVKISQPFYMGVYEVTQGEYEKVMESNFSSFSRLGDGSSKVPGLNTSQFPVERVPWYHAIVFCNELSAKDGLPAYYTLTYKFGSIYPVSVLVAGGNGYRLPTEAEWEYACRANTTTPFHFGSTLNGDKANVNGKNPYGTTTKGKFLERTTTVGSYVKNAFGLYDMHGNVFEWCQDVYDAKAYGSRSGTTAAPLVTSGSEFRVLRGCAWFNSPQFARAASRGMHTPDSSNDGIGFRVACFGVGVRSP